MANQPDPADPHLSSSPGDPPPLQTVLLATEGVHGAEAAQTLEGVVRAVRGVTAVRADAEAARVSITFDPRQTDVMAIHEAIERSGYQPSSIAP